MPLFCTSEGSVEIFDLTGVEPTYAAVVAFAEGGADPFTAQGTWSGLPHTISVTLAPEVEQATKIRTSDTGGSKVAPACSTAVTWTLTINSGLAIDDWLWCYVLETPTNPTTGKTAWFRLRPVGVAADDAQVYVYGTVQPGQFAFDNDSGEALTTEWTIELQETPVFPDCTGTSVAGA